MFEFVEVDLKFKFDK